MVGAGIWAMPLAFAQAGTSGGAVGKLSFPSAGERQAWVAAQVGETPPAQPITGTGATLDVPLEGVGPRDQVFVWDLGSGNIAARPASRARSGWAVSPTDEKWIGEVRVNLTRDAKPVASGRVRLTVGGKTREVLLSPSQKGQVTFFAVPPGVARVDVAYPTPDGTHSEPTQLVDLKLRRETPIVTLTVAASKAAETVESEAGATTGAGPAGQAAATATGTAPGASVLPPVRTSPLGSAIVYLVSLGLAGAAGYYALKWMQKNPKQLEAGLTKLGVKVPDPDATASGPPLSAPPAPEPVRPILLDDAAPTVIGGPALASSAAGMAGTTTAAVAGTPRLVRENGGTTELVEGETPIGREVPGALAMPTEDTLSRRHAVVVRSGDTVTVRDLGSTNGTFVNGVRVDEAVLRPGDAVQFGAVRFRYEG